MIQRVLTGVLVYELVALHTSLPTITTIVWAARAHPVLHAVSLALVLGGIAWLFWHLVVQGR